MATRKALVLVSGEIQEANASDILLSLAGEYISATRAAGAPITLTNNTVADITSITLTEGDWNIAAVAVMAAAATTSVTEYLASTNTVATTISSDIDKIFQWTQAAQVPGISPCRLHLVPSRLVVGALGATVYLNCRMRFTVSTATAYGMLWARRIGP